MRGLVLALLASGAAIAADHGATPTPAAAPAAATEAAAAATPHAATLPPFAAQLAQMPGVAGPSDWPELTHDEAWAALVAARPDTRQMARWRYAGSLIRQGRGADAFGVLETMRGDDEDLALVAPFQLATGAALTLMARDQEAVEALALPELAGNPEGCAWRLRALVHSGNERDAAREINCAVPAINARPGAARKPFTLAAAQAAISVGQGKPALDWLKLFNDQDPAANLLRGRALLAMGDPAGGQLRFKRAELSGTPEIVAGARLALIQSDLALHRIDPKAGIKQYEALRFVWRGGPIEQQALRGEFALATEQHDNGAALRSAATLFRYFKLGSESGAMLAQVQALLRTMLAPDSGVPLPEAAGLYWDYKELAPSGAEGDALAMQLAARLESAGLYARSAELLEYQLFQRRQDVAQGPLSVKVATLHILAGRPDRALDIIHRTEQPSYTDAMRWDRKRIEAVALHRLGRDDAAVAALDGVPDAAKVRAEIHWRTKDWGDFVTESEPTLPSPTGLTAPGQAAVLRQAVALAMLGREDKLAGLRARYAAAFKTLPSAQAFDMLTRPADKIDPARISAAMAVIPEASPAGSIGDLLDAPTG